MVLHDQPTALIVEDDRDASMIFQAALEEAGFEAVPILRGDDALRALRETTPEFILLDLHLPGTSGVDILGYVRDEPRLAQVIVVVATAHPQMADMVAEQADELLIKPVVFQQVVTVARRFLRRREESITPD